METGVFERGFIQISKEMPEEDNTTGYTDSSDELTTDQNAGQFVGPVQKEKILFCQWVTINFGDHRLQKYPPYPPTPMAREEIFSRSCMVAGKGHNSSCPPSTYQAEKRLAYNHVHQVSQVS